MKLNDRDRFIIVGLILATLVNLFSASFEIVFPNVFSSMENAFFYVTATLLLVWFLTVVARNVWEQIQAGRFAVEALILNDKNELLLFNHPFHKKLLPPCGRVDRSDMPHEAMKGILQERVGLNPKDYQFHPVFHELVDNQGADFEGVIRVPAPYLVQKEKRRQRGFVIYHYDFFYVLQLQNPNPQFPENQYSPHIWVDLDKLKQLVEKGRIFPDVLDAYQRVLRKLAEVERCTELLKG